MKYLRLFVLTTSLLVGAYATYRYLLGDFTSEAEAHMWWQLALLAVVIFAGVEIFRRLSEDEA